MSEDGPSDQGPLGDRVFRLVASVALVLGSGSGLWTLSTTDDRYRAADAARDFQLRDQELQHLKDEIDAARADIDRIDLGGAARPTQNIDKRVETIEERVIALERKVMQ